jgi:hypothetical protein
VEDPVPLAVPSRHRPVVAWWLIVAAVAISLLMLAGCAEPGPVEARGAVERVLVVKLQDDASGKATRYECRPVEVRR